VIFISFWHFVQKMSSKNSIAISDEWEDVDDPERWTDIFDNNDLKRRVIFELSYKHLL